MTRFGVHLRLTSCILQLLKPLAGNTIMMHNCISYLSDPLADEGDGGKPKRPSTGQRPPPPGHKPPAPSTMPPSSSALKSFSSSPNNNKDAKGGSSPSNHAGNKKDSVTTTTVTQSQRDTQVNTTHSTSKAHNPSTSPTPPHLHRYTHNIQCTQVLEGSHF